jgi:hypothetical protein
MDFEQELKQVAARYAAAGYDVVIRPTPEQLPPFAKDFVVELLIRRGDGNALVSVKRDLRQMRADKALSHYAAVLQSQRGWRYDLAVVRASTTLAVDVGDAEEPSPEDVARMLDDGEDLCRKGLLRHALVTAWAGLEAAMRRRYRASHEEEWAPMPRDVFTELYSNNDVIRFDELPRLQDAYRLRSQIVHGFAPPAVGEDVVPFLVSVARRLMQEEQAQAVRQSA